MFSLMIGLIAGLFISCIPTTPSEGEGEPVTEHVETITNQEGIGTFTVSDGQLSVEVLDADTEETIENIECFLSTDGTDAVILLVDPRGEYVPRLISCQNEYSNKGLVWAGLKRFYLKLKIKFIEGGSHLVYFDEYLPEGLTKEILYQQYEHINTTELKNLRRDLRGLVNALIDIGIGFIETKIITYVLSATIIGAPIGGYYFVASNCYTLNQIIELGVINDIADEYEKSGYEPNQKFEIWEAKWLLADFGSVLVLPCSPPISSIPPTAYIDSIYPNPAQQGETVTFNGHGTDPDGKIMFYRWESNIDGLLSNLESFSRSDLSVGTHTISFKVFDAGANPSDVVSKSLTITPVTPTPTPEIDDETKIQNVIRGFIQALNNQEWDNALSYCVFGSELFYEVYSEEELFYQEVMYFTYSEESFGEIIINGEYAQVSVYFTMSSFLNGELLSEDTTELIFLLQKIGNSWKIYDCGGPETPTPTPPTTY